MIAFLSTWKCLSPQFLQKARSVISAISFIQLHILSASYGDPTRSSLSALTQLAADRDHLGRQFCHIRSMEA